MVLKCGELRNLSQWSPEGAGAINMGTAVLQTLPLDPWENSKAPRPWRWGSGMAKLSSGTCANVDSAVENVHRSFPLGYLQPEDAAPTEII